MRHQPEVEQMTRLLLQKPKAYADLDEMSRMAISVLTDEGWGLSRVAVEMNVLVTATPVIQEDDPANVANARLVQHVADAELRISALRKKIADMGADEWLVMAAAFVVAAIMGLAGAGRWIWTLIPVCFVCYAIARRIARKGAK